jgi:hypothetical protein
MDDEDDDIVHLPAEPRYSVHLNEYRDISGRLQEFPGHESIMPPLGTTVYIYHPQNNFWPPFVHKCTLEAINRNNHWSLEIILRDVSNGAPYEMTCHRRSENPLFAREEGVTNWWRQMPGSRGPFVLKYLPQPEAVIELNSDSDGEERKSGGESGGESDGENQERKSDEGKDPQGQQTPLPQGGKRRKAKRTKRKVNVKSSRQTKSRFKRKTRTIRRKH